MEFDADDIFGEPENNNENEVDNSQNKDSADGTSTGVKVSAPKRIIKNPRVKFNAERLCGERGIPVLVDHFKNVRFKGKGYEKEDLDKLLSHLEHWTHRLFPSMKFKDCLHQIEKLGKKRPVQTCLRKIRLDMPILNNDFIENDDDDDNVQRNDDPEPPSSDAFDRLIEESQDLLNSNISSSENINAVNTSYSSPLPTQNVGHVLGSSFGSSLTDEQKERMERNKMLAAERRKARLSAVQPDVSKSTNENIQVTSSQETSHTHDKFFIPDAFKPQDNVAVTSSSSSAENMDKDKENTFVLKDQNSEILGLDDLLDCVNDEGSESTQKFRSTDTDSCEDFNKNFEDVQRKNKNVAVNDYVKINEVESNVVEHHVGDSNADNKMHKMSTSKTNEYLELDELIDLVEE